MTDYIVDSARTPRKWLTRYLILNIIVADALRLTLILVVAELLLQWYLPEYARHRYDRRFTGGHPIAMNVDGYRGPVVSKNPSHELMRVVALGDSTTFGVGVAWNSSWPAQLQNILEHKSSQPVEVINAGLPAASLRELTTAFQRKWAYYKPDTVVLAISGNMIANAWDRRNSESKMPRNKYLSVVSPQERISRLLERVREWRYSLCLPSFLMDMGTIAFYQIGLRTHHLDATCPMGPLLAYGYIQGNLSEDLADTAWSIFERELIELRYSVSRANAKLIVTYLPCRFYLTDDWVDNLKAVPRKRLKINPIEKSRLICRDAKIDYVDAMKALRTERAVVTAAFGKFEPLYVLGDYNHLDYAGHRTVAQAVSVKVLMRGNR